MAANLSISDDETDEEVKRTASEAGFRRVCALLHRRACLDDNCIVLLMDVMSKEKERVLGEARTRVLVVTK